MNRLERVSCHNFVEIGRNIYFSNWFYNGLFKVEIETGRTTFLGHFSNEKLTERNIHWELFIREDRIFFLPRRGRHVHIYDLFSKCIDSVEIRKESDEFDVIIDVMMQEDYLIFFPFKKKIPIRRLDLKTLKVTNVDENLKFQGRYLSKERELFPAQELLEKYNIDGKDFFSWKKLMNGKWCGFMPMGAKMLWYTEGISELEMIPLILINGEKLKKYLYNLRRMLMKEGSVQESQSIGINEFGNDLIVESISSYDYLKKNCNIGNEIWKIVK